MPRLPTVTVHRPGAMDEKMIINESDYDPKRHRLWDPDSLVEIRAEAITAAIRGFDPENKELWTRDGQPTVKAIEAVLGYNIHAGERDTAWEAILAAEAGTGSAGGDGSGDGTATA